MNVIETNRALEVIEARIDELAEALAEDRDATYQRVVKVEMTRLLQEHDDLCRRFLS